MNPSPVMSSRIKVALAGLATLLVALMLALGCQGSDGSDSEQEIIFYDLAWETSSLQSQIAAFIVEHGYENPVSIISGSPLAFYPALGNGTAHVNMEVWLPNQQEPYDEIIADGSAIDLGDSIDDSWQGWGIPQYVKDANPGLVSVLDLPDYAGQFATAETHGKARFVNCVSGWACEQINADKLTGYGMGGVVHLVNPGSEAAILADLSSAYLLEEAWLGYVWGPSQMALDFDLYVLEEPAYSSACWDTDKACAFPLTTVNIVVDSSLENRAPEVVAFLRQWDFKFEHQLPVSRWMEEQGMTPAEGALHYLRTRADLWKPMVTEEAAARVEDALAAAG